MSGDLTVNDRGDPKGFRPLSAAELVGTEGGCAGWLDEKGVLHGDVGKPGGPGTGFPFPILTGPTFPVPNPTQPTG